MHDRLKQEAMHDPLTRLYNRRLLLERMQQAMAHAERHQEPLSIVFVDVDQLKHINDTYGHLAGDALLREVGVALTDAVRAEDVVARYGGDEFVVVCRGVGDGAAPALCRRIGEALRVPIDLPDGDWVPTATRCELWNPNWIPENPASHAMPSRPWLRRLRHRAANASSSVTIMPPSPVVICLLG